MLGERRIKEITDAALAASAAEQTEVVLISREEELTRFANSTIHQNVAESDAELRVRVVQGRRIGVASSNDLTQGGIEKVVQTASSLARLQRENPDFRSLPVPQPTVQVEAFVEATAGYTPEDRARVAGTICREAVAHGAVASGTFSTARMEIAVANSLGVFAYHRATAANASTVIMADSGSGWASLASPDATEVDGEAMAREALDKALRSREPTLIEPGDYTVILEEYAVADLLRYLALMGFGALAVQEQRSFMAGKFGQQIVGQNISIWDDGLDTSGFPMPFDFEGVPKQRVDLIERGVARGVVYDSYTAGREEGKASTGHALPAPNTSGPLPLHLFMACGEATRGEMLASTERGLWITRFHYIRPVHPLQTIITGMTRDGTFLIEGGEIARPVRNLRFTQSILEALSNVEAIGPTTRLNRGFLGAARAPALKLRNFTFTGVTEF